MVSKASDDLPDPDRPVRTINRLRGSTRSMCLRLCSAAPLMTMESTDMPVLGAFPADDALLVELAILGHVLPAVNAGERAALRPRGTGPACSRKPPLGSPRAAHRANSARRGPGARSHTAARAGCGPLPLEIDCTIRP